MAAQMMRRILIDHARGRKTAKRGGDRVKLTLGAVPATDPNGQVIDLLDLDDALKKLEQLNARHSAVVELRYFGGLSLEETADVLGVSTHTVRLDWSMARAWLHQHLDGHGSGEPSAKAD
jgi:RNA polymerase sigma factor (TIGR02999 family)